MNWVLINDETEFGITIHFVDEGIDTGDIISQKVFPIDDSDNYSTLLERAFHGCADLLYNTLQTLRIIHTKKYPNQKFIQLVFIVAVEELVMK